MKNILPLCALAALLSGCSHSDSHKAASALTTVPIEGAFGWKLGDKLSLQGLEPLTPGTWSTDKGRAPLLTQMVSCLDDGTIYSIEGQGGGASEAVVQALDLKYGTGAMTKCDMDGAEYEWQNGARTIQAVVIHKNDVFSVTYTDTKIQEQWFDKQRAAQTAIATNLATKL
jgi:hypothetical protein